jgi:hypothetical protein
MRKAKKFFMMLAVAVFVLPCVIFLGACDDGKIDYGRQIALTNALDILIDGPVAFNNTLDPSENIQGLHSMANWEGTQISLTHGKSKIVPATNEFNNHPVTLSWNENSSANAQSKNSETLINVSTTTTTTASVGNITTRNTESGSVFIANNQKTYTNIRRPLHFPNVQGLRTSGLIATTVDAVNDVSGDSLYSLEQFYEENRVMLVERYNGIANLKDFKNGDYQVTLHYSQSALLHYVRHEISPFLSIAGVTFNTTGGMAVSWKFNKNGRLISAMVNANFTLICETTATVPEQTVFTLRNLFGNNGQTIRINANISEFKGNLQTQARMGNLGGYFDGAAWLAFDGTWEQFVASQG